MILIDSKKIFYLSSNIKEFKQFRKNRMDMDLNKFKFGLFILHKNSIILNISIYLKYFYLSTTYK